MSQMELFEQQPAASMDTAGFPLPNLAADAAGLFELSADACCAALYARMSELPIQDEIARFIEKVEKAAKATGGKASGDTAEAARKAAARSATDRGDPDVLAVLQAAYKVQHEIHRLMGLLRFTPDNAGVYTARCAPDHYILPALAEHFTLRFGTTPWAIIDEKRNLCLYRGKDGETRLKPAPDGSLPKVGFQAAGDDAADAWEDMWRLYYRSVNNEARKNTRLRQQFMPGRYQKYLNEMDDSGGETK